MSGLVRALKAFAADLRRTETRGRIAGLLVVGAALAELITFVFPLCREHLASVGTSPVVRVCGPLMPPELVAGVVLVALLWPTIAKFTLPGGAGIEKRISQAERSTGAVAFMAGPSAEPPPRVVELPSAVELVHAWSEIELYLDEARGTEWQPIIRHLERPQLEVLERQVVLDWAKRFDSEIRTVRDAVSHRGHIKTPAVEEAALVARRLLEILKARLD